MSSARAVVACDLDGVVWRGDAPIPAAADGRRRVAGGGPAGGVRLEQLELAGR